MYFDRHHRAEPLVHAPTEATVHGATAHAAHRATAHGATTVAVLSHKVAKEAHQHVRLAAAITKGTAAHSTLAVTILIHDLSKDLGINQLQHTFFPILSI